ncbi:MAG: N-acetyltransferase [Moraxellaceae bacterium]|jgi:predicted N-acyltransferase|nr:N-acetyltransferase [Moraxellaceae bacterium]
MASRTWRQLSRLGPDIILTASASARDPFLSLPFLHALEASAAIGPHTSWEPAHLIFARDGNPAALLPMYRKRDSRGEYVFDHAWAGAYQRYGLAYYPKLVTAVPFTPVPGPRLLLTPGENEKDWMEDVLAAVRQECESQGASGWHGLFVNQDWVTPAMQAGFAIREGCRFHWRNRAYRDFEDFLDTLTSKKRKDIRRERRRLAEKGVTCRRLSGSALEETAWDFFFECYVRTYQEHGQRPYLNRNFFRQIADSMADQLTLVMAEDLSGPIASALFFHSESTLYGRYWGALRPVDGLHFETCYYQGVEHCIERGLTDFDPGTQGEHKLLRGFAPTLTYSLHWLREPAFQSAILRFVKEEQVEVRRYLQAAQEALPYRQQ